MLTVVWVLPNLNRSPYGIPQMRPTAFIPILALAMLNGCAQAQTQTPESSDQAERILDADSQTPVETTSYDFMAHRERIDVIFEEHILELLRGEREKIEALLPKHKAVMYMDLFERGMRSRTGLIMLSSGADYWLELAYREGFARKMLFYTGYFAARAKLAEQTE